MLSRPHSRFFSVLFTTISIFAIAALSGGDIRPAHGQSGAGASISLPTEMHLRDPGWWPTKRDVGRDEYVGSEQCTSCHEAIAVTYRTTAMAQAATLAADSLPLRNHASLDYSLGSYKGQIQSIDSQAILTVSGGPQQISRNLVWAFGEAHMGQTFVYELDGKYFESHMSFYRAIQSLDVTPGQTRDLPSSAESAAGRQMDPGEPELCFGCHTTESSTKNQFDPHNAILGVTCEHCHGPGAKHVAAMSLGMEAQSPSYIMNPARLGPLESVDFCGACHRTWEDVVKGGFVGLGVYNVRFAPYRLENSKCWGSGDARITCIACHDPHKRLVTDAALYDSKCLRCHILKGAKKSADHPGAACPKASENCVTCHMPKIEPPNLHSSFTDHWIRVVQRGKPYPD